MRIGILGGTFDPIHFGHIRPALEIRRQLKLDKVWLMPNHIPPHKSSTCVSTAQRLEMVQLICDQYDEFELCDIEARRDSPSYLVTTLNQLRDSHPNDEFYFIVGMDSLMSLPSWYKWRSLFELCHIVVAQRHGWDLTKNSEVYVEYQRRLSPAASIPHQASGLIIPIEITPQPYSSTEIRQQLSDDVFPEDALPKQIIEFIQVNRLYRP
ncbi:nicotinate-nucleotide adenylyltransferase [Shewanella atlantica]|uniref:nicotinate-nucleotide adenylyltransferase n=1 Tax=Shewanella atlantica TaxID=271099 RepID=UPI003735C1A4